MANPDEPDEPTHPTPDPSPHREEGQTSSEATGADESGEGRAGGAGRDSLLPLATPAVAESFDSRRAEERSESRDRTRPAERPPSRRWGSAARRPSELYRAATCFGSGST